DAAGDAGAGKLKSLGCAGCHVTKDPASRVPHLAGQSESYLARQLKAFRQGDRAKPPVSAIPKPLTARHCGELRAFSSRQPAGSDAKPIPEAEAITKSQMAFPRDFPNGFVLYLTTNNAEYNTVKKIYINAIGFSAARDSKPLPDGSVIIVANYAA